MERNLEIWSWKSFEKNIWSIFLLWSSQNVSGSSQNVSGTSIVKLSQCNVLQCFSFPKVKVSFSTSSNLNCSYVWSNMISFIIKGMTILLLSLLCSNFIWRLFCIQPLPSLCLFFFPLKQIRSFFIIFLTRSLSKTAYNCIPCTFSQLYVFLLKCNDPNWTQIFAESLCFMSTVKQLLFPMYLNDSSENQYQPLFCKITIMLTVAIQ